MSNDEMLLAIKEMFDLKINELKVILEAHC